MLEERSLFSPPLDHTANFRWVAAASGAVVLRADAATALALALRRLGRMVEAEHRRQDAIEGYGTLGAEALSRRLEREWEAAG